MQGYVEGSNVSVVEEFINMIVSQRAYEATRKVVKAADEMYQQVNGGATSSRSRTCCSSCPWYERPWSLCCCLRGSSSYRDLTSEIPLFQSLDPAIEVGYAPLPGTQRVLHRAAGPHCSKK